LLDNTAQPVFIDGNVYAKGTSDNKKTLWKYSTTTHCWSQLSPPPGIESIDYLITSYQGQLVWIGGTTYKSENEYERNKCIFILYDYNWREDIPPLPIDVSSKIMYRVIASSDDKYLIVIIQTTNDEFNLLIFNGDEWINRKCPKLNPGCLLGDVLVHDKTVYLMEPNDNGRYCYTISLKSLL
jgi:hypothetical protein